MSRFELPPPFCKGCQNGDSFYKWTCNKNLIFRIQRFRNYELWRDYLSSTSWVYCIYLALFVVIIMTILFMTIGLIVNRKNKSLWIHSEVILYLLFWRKKNTPFTQKNPKNRVSQIFYLSTYIVVYERVHTN